MSYIGIMRMELEKYCLGLGIFLSQHGKIIWKLEDELATGLSRGLQGYMAFLEGQGGLVSRSVMGMTAGCCMAGSIYKYTS